MRIVKVEPEKYRKELAELVSEVAHRLNDMRNAIMNRFEIPPDRHKEVMFQLLVDFVTSLMAYVSKQENKIALDMFEFLSQFFNTGGEPM